MTISKTNLLQQPMSDCNAARPQSVGAQHKTAEKSDHVHPDQGQSGIHGAAGGQSELNYHPDHHQSDTQGSIEQPRKERESG